MAKARASRRAHLWNQHAAAGTWVDQQPRYTNTAKRFEITDRRTSGRSQVLLVLAGTGRMRAARSGLGDRAAAAVLPLPPLRPKALLFLLAEAGVLFKLRMQDEIQPNM